MTLAERYRLLALAAGAPVFRREGSLGLWLARGFTRRALSERDVQDADWSPAHAAASPAKLAGGAQPAPDAGLHPARSESANGKQAA